MMVPIIEEKYFSSVCIKARSGELSLLAAVYKSKDQYNTLYHEGNAETKHHEEMQFSAHYPNTVVGQGRVHISFMLK